MAHAGLTAALQVGSKQPPPLGCARSRAHNASLRSLCLQQLLHLNPPRGGRRSPTTLAVHAHEQQVPTYMHSGGPPITRLMQALRRRAARLAAGARSHLPAGLRSCCLARWGPVCACGTCPLMHLAANRCARVEVSLGSSKKHLPMSVSLSEPNL